MNDVVALDNDHNEYTLGDEYKVRWNNFIKDIYDEIHKLKFGIFNFTLTDNLHSL